MISLFADLSMHQRFDVVKENLKKVVIPPKEGADEIADFDFDEH